MDKPLPLPLKAVTRARRCPLFSLSLYETPFVRRLVGCLLLFGLSSSLVLPSLGYPCAIIFDETYYIPNAQKYLHGEFFLQTHPPLGVLLMVAGERWLHPDAPANEFVAVDKIEDDWPSGTDITGYRLFPALFGVLIPLVVFMILAAVLRRELLALVVSSFVALDNALIVQARAAMLDSALIFFSLAAILTFILLVRRPWLRPGGFYLLAALFGVLAAGAANVKISGAYVAVLVPIYAVTLLRTRQFRRLFFFMTVVGTLFAITFVGLWQIHFAIARQLAQDDYGISAAHRDLLSGAYQPDPFTRLAIQFKDGMGYSINSGFDVGKLDLGDPDEIGSPWYWWLVGGRSINYRWETDDGVSFRYITMLGNPATWLVSLLGVVLGTALVLADLLYRFLHPSHRRWLGLFVILYWAYMIPIILTQRVTYLYHYLPVLVLGVILFGLVLRQAPALAGSLQRDTLVVAAILVVFSFWVYKPLTYYDPLTNVQFQQRAIWPAWDLRCADCKPGERR